MRGGIMLAGDLETTDLLKPGATELHFQPFITEAYFCKLDGTFKIKDEFETFIKPVVPIPEHITEITGITNDMVRNAPSFIEIYDDLCEFFLGEEIFFAHNATFEIGCLESELARHDLVTNFPWPKKQICTVEVSECLQNKRLTLAKLCQHYGIQYADGHRAKRDTMMMVECIKKMDKEGLIDYD